jgi:hypothetical protein
MDAMLILFIAGFCAFIGAAALLGGTIMALFFAATALWQIYQRRMRIEPK